jgi:hypothetical protein
MRTRKEANDVEHDNIDNATRTSMHAGSPLRDKPTKENG